MSGSFFNERDIAEISAFKHFMRKCFRFSRWFAVVGFAAGGIAAIVFSQYQPPSGTFAYYLWGIFYGACTTSLQELYHAADLLGIVSAVEIIMSPPIDSILCIVTPAFIVAGIMFVVGIACYCLLIYGSGALRRLTKSPLN